MMNLHSQNQTTIVGLMSFKNGRHLKVNKQKNQSLSFCKERSRA